MAVNDILLANGSADTSAYNVPGGRYAFLVDGDFSGGGSVALEILSPDGTNWLSTGDDAVLTAEGAVLVDLPPGAVRLNITGTVAAIYAQLRKIPQR